MVLADRKLMQTALAQLVDNAREILRTVLHRSVSPWF